MHVVLSYNIDMICDMQKPNSLKIVRTIDPKT